MSAYRKAFDETKYTSFLIEDNELLERYNGIWDKRSYASGREFDINPVYKKKYLKTRTKSYKGEINSNFHSNGIQKERYETMCLSATLIDTVFRTGKNYYPQVFLEECKYIVKEKKIHNYFIDDMEVFSDSDKENLLEKI